MYPPDLIGTNPLIPADVLRDFLSEQELKTLLEQAIDNSGEAKQESQNSRRVASFGNKYNYSRIANPTQKIPDWLMPLKTKLENKTGQGFNQVSVTYYKPDSSLGRHADDENSIVPGSVIAGVSLGDTRQMAFYSRHRVSELGRISLIPGSLLLMKADEQFVYDHEVWGGVTNEVNSSLFQSWCHLTQPQPREVHPHQFLSLSL